MLFNKIKIFSYTLCFLFSVAKFILYFILIKYGEDKVKGR